MSEPSVCVVGLGMTGFDAVSAQSVLSLAAEAARLAIADAGLKPAQVDGAIQLLSDFGGGYRSRHDDSFARVMHLPVNVYLENVGHGGDYCGYPMLIAEQFLSRGICSYVVCAAAKTDLANAVAARERGVRGASAHVRHGNWGAWHGEAAPLSHALMATRHMHLYGTKPEHFGAVAVAARRAGALNPLAQLRTKPLTLDDYMALKPVVEPYRRPDICLQSEGAIAFVVTTKERARDLPRPPIFAAGVGFGEQMARLWPDKQSYTQLPIAPARDAAFRQAGIGLDAIDVAQLYDCFSAEVILQLEDYGWCAKGEGGPFVAAGSIGPGGAIPVNTGGGLLAAHHMGNLTGFAEAIIQLRGDAGARQITGARTALVTASGGEIVSGDICCSHSCLILQRP